MEEKNQNLDILRHSCAHIMAHAINRLLPDAKFGIGPTITDGFYYDIDTNTVISPEFLPKIEAEMKKIIKENNEFKKEELNISDAIALFKNQNQSYKIELIEDLNNKENTTKVTIYKEGDFIDLCRGPHVEKTGQIRIFKLTSVAGAYWRGDEKNKQLQRIYGTAFFDKEELKEHLRLLEEAKKRDHRKLGKELDLFTFHPEAPASPFFHPKGTILYNRLIKHMRAINTANGYQEVITPQIMDVALWKKSGHYDHYKENMYFTQIEDREYAVKPMNCPGHMAIYMSQKISYRDLPLRYSDFGRVHRHELSGATHGLFRVRTFTQDDGHVFCTPETLDKEIHDIYRSTIETYDLFGMGDVKIFLSTRPKSRVGSEELWDNGEAILKKALDHLKRPYEIAQGDGAFYGPKIDFHVKDAIKRTHQLGTLQIDFNLPERFDLHYIGADNAKHRPIMLHRAMFGSLERFMGILTEHFAGAFPFWISPVQARIIPISDTHIPYCEEAASTLKKSGIRVEVDTRNASMGLKVREAQKAKIPFSLVAGDKEIENNSFAVRKYGEQNSSTLTQNEIIKEFTELNDVPTKALIKS